MRRIDQSVDRQIAALEHFQRKGDLSRLGFAIEMDLPRNCRGSDGKRYAAAESPPGWIPYIPVVDPWFISLALAEMLAEMFATDNDGRKIDFYPALFALNEDSGGKIFYAYGSACRDSICSQCGGITVVRPDQESVECAVCGNTNG